MSRRKLSKPELTYKISNHKHQIINKSQIPIPNDQNRFGILNFGHCDLFEICYLLFGIFGDLSTPKCLAFFTGKIIRQRMLVILGKAGYNFLLILSQTGCLPLIALDYRSNGTNGCTFT
jgi:hypothetical protein